MGCRHRRYQSTTHAWRRLLTLVGATALLIVASNSNAQFHTVDSAYTAAFESLINTYRMERRLVALKQSDELKPVAEHHAEYLSRWYATKPFFNLTHDENIRVDGIRALGSLEKRFEHFGFTSGWGECVVYVDASAVASPDEIIALLKSSAPHDRLIRERSFCRYALSVWTFKHDENIVTIGVLALANR